MKSKNVVIIFLILYSGFLSAQIKVFDGGSVSLGFTLNPQSGCKLQVMGNCLFTENTSSIESAAMISGLNDYSIAEMPDYIRVYQINQSEDCDTTSGYFPELDTNDYISRHTKI